jgi:hypothetical protein
MEASFSHESGAEKSTTGLEKTPVDSALVQAMLALLWYSRQNNLEIDLLKPETISHETKNKAMELWVGDMSNRSLSSDYRDYVSKHGEEFIDVTKREDLIDLLDVILKGEEETAH